MNRYFACLLFESEVDDGSDLPPLVEESVRLVFAEDESAARLKAGRFGKEAEHDYLNDDGARVTWRFVRVLDVQEFCEQDFCDGVEVYGRLERRSPTDS